MSGSFDIMFLFPKNINFTLMRLLFYSMQYLIKTLSIEELLQLLVENFKLVFKVLIVLTMSNFVDDLLTSFQIGGLATSMELILKSVFDFTLQV